MNTISNKKYENPSFHKILYFRPAGKVDLQFIIRGGDKLQINLAGLIVGQNSGD